MIITAKYASRCPSCGMGIHAGAQVEWQSGRKATHLHCKPDTKTDASARKTRRPTSRPTSYRSKRTSCRECRGPLTSVPHCRATDEYCGQCAYDNE